MFQRASRVRMGQHTRCARDQRGVAVVEFAFIAMFILTILAGTVDFGRGWHSSMAVTEAARTGVRVGSGQGKAPGADYYALTGVKASLDTAGKLPDVELVVVYKASSLDGKVPSTCLSGSPSGNCNVLTGAQFRALDKPSFDLTFVGTDPPTGTGCLRNSAARRNAWCPGNRENKQSAADYYGVYIEYRQRNLFPISGDARKITRHAVMRIEPIIDI